MIEGAPSLQADLADVWSETALNAELVDYVRKYAAGFAGSGAAVAVEFVERVVAHEGSAVSVFSGARLAEEVLDGEAHLQASLCWFRWITAEKLGFRKLKTAHLAEQCSNPTLEGFERVEWAVQLQTKGGPAFRDVRRGTIGRVDPPGQRRELDVVYYWLADHGQILVTLEVGTGPPVDYDMALALSDRLAASVRINS